VNAPGRTHQPFSTNEWIWSDERIPFDSDLNLAPSHRIHRSRRSVSEGIRQSKLCNWLKSAERAEPFSAATEVTEPPSRPASANEEVGVAQARAHLVFW
jgi:hypothetical protein